MPRGREITPERDETWTRRTRQRASLPYNLPHNMPYNLLYNLPFNLLYNLPPRCALNRENCTSAGRSRGPVRADYFSTRPPRALRTPAKSLRRPTKDEAGGERGRSDIGGRATRRQQQARRSTRGARAEEIEDSHCEQRPHEQTDHDVWRQPSGRGESGDQTRLEIRAGPRS